MSGQNKKGERIKNEETRTTGNGARWSGGVVVWSGVVGCGGVPMEKLKKSEANF